jgi:hypothetical protein
MLPLAGASEGGHGRQGVRGELPVDRDHRERAGSRDLEELSQLHRLASFVKWTSFVAKKKPPRPGRIAEALSTGPATPSRVEGVPPAERAIPQGRVRDLHGKDGSSKGVRNEYPQGSR